MWDSVYVMVGYAGILLLQMLDVLIIVVLWRWIAGRTETKTARVVIEIVVLALLSLPVYLGLRQIQLNFPQVPGIARGVDPLLPHKAAIYVAIAYLIPWTIITKLRKKNRGPNKGYGDQSRGRAR